MNELKPTQRLLFESARPNWNSLPHESQQQLLEVLSQLVLEGLCDSTTTPTEFKEDHHVS